MRAERIQQSARGANLQQLQRPRRSRLVKRVTESLTIANGMKRSLRAAEAASSHVSAGLGELTGNRPGPGRGSKPGVTPVTST